MSASAVSEPDLEEFQDVDEVVDRFRAHGYLADRRLATTVFLQTRLRKPLLVEGPAGVGKTQLAQRLAEVTGRRLLRLQCYEGQDESTALYEWDYGKQLLYTQILREKIGQLVADTTSLDEAMERIARQDNVFFSERFLAPRPLLESISSPEPVVLLIDEVDRADEALEAVLLEFLSEFQISIPEVGTITAEQLPYVVLTSNNTRDLSAALKRRCLHLFLDYPSPERELEILRSKDTGLPDALAARLVEVVRGLRALDLRKPPGISETVDWARTLAVLGVTELSADVLADTLSVVVKYERDLARAGQALPRLVDPNASLPDGRPDHDHAHGHDHPHSHTHPDGSAHPDAHDDHHPDRLATGLYDEEPASHTPLPALADDDGAGKAIRWAMDQPGRHDEGYYRGERGLRPTVPAGQASRSFAARRARRRPV